jgi:hypothetical protein
MLHRAVYRPARSDDLIPTRMRLMLRGSRLPEPTDIVRPPRVTRIVPRRSGPVNVAVTLRIEVLAEPPRAGLVDLILTCAAAGAASSAAVTAAMAAAPRALWMMRIGYCSPRVGCRFSE